MAIGKTGLFSKEGQMTTDKCGFFSKEKVDDKDQNFDDVLLDLYGDSSQKYKDRFVEVSTMYTSTFGVSDFDFFSSPGRIEIVGNHTDHNGGKVLAAAISVDILASASKSKDGIIEIKSYGYPMLHVDTEDAGFCINEIGTSTAIIKGVVEYFVKSGKNVGGFSAYMTSSVPKGAGVSSSSSFELAIAEILNVMYNSGELTAMFKAKASQYAENTFFGKPCGLMDQSSIALGGVNLIDFKSFGNPQIEKVQWQFDDLDIFVVATGGDHSDLTDDYSAILSDMKTVATEFSKKLLVEVPKEQFMQDKDRLKNVVSERAYLRAEHYYEENERVEIAMNAIKMNDEQSFLRAVNESGLSSKYKLQNLYSPKGGNHNLERALDAVGKIDGVCASRVHGGGFAGTILVFIKKAKSDKANEQLNAMFAKENVFKLAIRGSGACKI